MINFNVYRNIPDSSIVSVAIEDPKHIETTKAPWAFRFISNNDVSSNSVSELLYFKDNPYKNRGFAASGNKIFFGLDCSFPALLLSRLDIDIKRVVNIDKADICVCDRHKISYSWGYYLIYKDPNEEKYYASSNSIFGDEIEETYNKWVKALGENIEVNVVTFCSSSDLKRLKFYNSTEIPITFTDEFVNCVQAKLPKLSDDETQNIINMLSSPDRESYIAAINMLVYYNIQDRKLDIIYGLYNSDFLSSANSGLNKNETYIYLLLGFEPKEIFDSSKYSSNIIDGMLRLINKNPGINQNVDKLRKLFTNKMYEIINQNNSIERMKTSEFCNLDFELVDPEEEIIKFEDKDIRVRCLKLELFSTIHKIFMRELNFLKLMPKIIDKVLY